MIRNFKKVNQYNEINDFNFNKFAYETHAILLLKLYKSAALLINVR